MQRLILSSVLAASLLALVGCGQVDNGATEPDSVPPMPSSGPSAAGASSAPPGPPPATP